MHHAASQLHLACVGPAEPIGPRNAQRKCVSVYRDCQAPRGCPRAALPAGAPRLRDWAYNRRGCFRDSLITMVPDLEALGIRVLLNECVVIERGRDSIYLAGVDDAHLFRADNIEKAAAGVPQCSRAFGAGAWRHAGMAGYTFGGDGVLARSGALQQSAGAYRASAGVRRK